MTLDYNEMLQLCTQKPEFRAKIEVVDGVEVTIFSYMVAMRDTFDSELAKEFRGTVFRNDTQECICRPFPKFFNLGERPETQKDQINWNKAQFFVKYDGSMATPVLINGKIFWKTKNSFYSDVAKKIQTFWQESLHEGDNFFSSKNALMYCLKNYYYTPIFEYVAPHNQIVLAYDTEALKYLGFRDIQSGIYWPYIGNQNSDISYDEIINMTDIEGFVVQDDQKLFKMKTKWYLDRHKICTEFNPKVIIRATLDETIDDLIGVAAQLGLIEQQNQMEDLRDETLRTKLEFESQIKHAWSLVNRIEDQKEFAFAVQNQFPKQWWPFMFSMKKNKDFSAMLNDYVFDTVYTNYKTIE